MNGFEIIAYCTAGFLFSIFTGIAGGGAGFILTPLGILLGLSPAQAITSSKFNGLAANLGGLSATKHDIRKVNRLFLVICCVIALVVGIGVPLIIKSLDQGIYQKTLGGLMLLLVPIIWKKQIGIKKHLHAKPRFFVGTIATTVSFILLGLFSSGMGLLINICLMHYYKLPAIDAIILKRLSQTILNIAIIIGLLGTGLIIWKIVIPIMFCTAAGTYIGSKIALEKGNTFIMHTTLIIMILSGLYLLFS